VRSAVRGATDGLSELNQAEDAEVMTEYLRDQIERVATDVNLGPNRPDKQGYAEG
jgi:hypothetical protein